MTIRAYPVPVKAHVVYRNIMSIGETCLLSPSSTEVIGAYHTPNRVSFCGSLSVGN